MTCVAQHMDEVMPFGEDPRKLASTVKRSMVAVRALEKALKSGFQIAEEMKKVNKYRFSYYNILTNQIVLKHSIYHNMPFIIYVPLTVDLYCCNAFNTQKYLPYIIITVLIQHNKSTYL